MVRIDRVKKSSGGIEGKLIAEKDLAADLRARSEAVKLDLKTDLSGLKGLRNWDLETFSSGSVDNLISNSSSSRSPPAKGCSSTEPGGDTTGSRDLRIGVDLLRRDNGLGVLGVSKERPSLVKDSSNDGIESMEYVLVDMAEPMLQSLTLSSSSMASWGGERSMSSGLRLRDQLRSFSEPWPQSMTSSTVKDLTVRRRRRSCLGRGISVTARRATSDGEMESGENESRGRLRCDVCRFCGWAMGRLPLVVGILTGLVGVVGRVVKLVVVVGGLDGERHRVSRLSLRLPMLASEFGGTGMGVMVTAMLVLSLSYLGDQRRGEKVGGVVVVVAA